MNKKFTFFVILVLLFSLSFQTPTEVIGVETQISEVKQDEITSKSLDLRAQILSDYLAKFNSPMQNHAQDFVDAADKYGLDWKMLPAIAGVESTFGKRIPGGYNAYGWGVYGTNRIYFTSWTDGIFTVAKGLREGYLDKGLTDPYSMNRVYAESPAWGGKVSFFMNEIEKFSANYKVEEVYPEVTSPKTAANSGQLASQ